MFRFQRNKENLLSIIIQRKKYRNYTNLFVGTQKKLYLLSRYLEIYVDNDHFTLICYGTNDDKKNFISAILFTNENNLAYVNNYYYISKQTTNFIHITILINNNKLTILTNPNFCAVYLDSTANNPSESASHFSEYFGPVFQTPINIYYHLFREWVRLLNQISKSKVQKLILIEGTYSFQSHHLALTIVPSTDLSEFLRIGIIYLSIT
ncbi:hypothetical protein AGLY_003842 [Aphis glycines]|uniref:Uncharacterized protein n=1 Tax=Aphis glycines TaxID=307491 RepID=A0A6G0TZV0_APHGL|nr:hypothetical protein AGLY_003842 [Aphis glycines]